MEATPAVHPAEKLLRAYGSGQLDAARAGELSRHLEECETCRNRVSQVSPGRLRQALLAPETLPSDSPPLPQQESREKSPTSARSSPGILSDWLAEHPDYIIHRELGQGGMGVVYLAENTLMGRKEVLKVVRSHLLEKQGAVDRFLREIRLAAQLHHPNIVTAYWAGRIGLGLVFAMEYVDGYDLAKLVTKSGPLPLAHACNFVYQAAQGLQHAHVRGMVHRDIKPSNLMVAREGNRPLIKILDFGLAKVTSERPIDGSLTQEGQMLGSPHYMAPEQCVDAQKADIRADIYSLGCTLYCLLSGRPPFQASTLYGLLQAHHSMDAQPLSAIRPEVPAELDALVSKMMAKQPARRFQTPAEVAKALAPFFKRGGAALFALDQNLRISTPSSKGSDFAATPPAAGASPAPVAFLPQTIAEHRGPPPAALTAVENPHTLVEALPQAPAGLVKGRHVWTRRNAIAMGAGPLAVVLVGIMLIMINRARPPDAGRRREIPVAKAEAAPEVPAAPSKPGQFVTSRFAKDDDEGWKTANRLGFGQATKWMITNWDGTNAWLTARDVSNQRAWGWLAPAKFLGNHSEKFGRWLFYSTRVDRSNASKAPGLACSVRLRGGNQEIFVDSGGGGRPVPGRWTRYRIKLDSTGGWNLVRGDGQSAKATDQDIRRVLSDVTELWIKGEYYGHGEDTGDLDDVVFGAEPSELEISAEPGPEQIAESHAASPIEPAKPADTHADRRGRAVGLLDESLTALKQLNFSRNPERARTRDRSVAAIQEVIKQVEKGLFPIQRLQGVREDLQGVQRVAVVGSNKKLLSSVDSWLAQTMEILAKASLRREAGESRTGLGADPASVHPRGEASEKE